MKALVTGCNRGIGLELVRQLKKKGYEVLAVVRTNSEALAGVADQVIEGVDLLNAEAVDKVTHGLADHDFDLVIQNAGLLVSMPFEQISSQPMLDMFKVNALAPILFSAKLAPKIKPGGKLVVITSRMGSMADNTSGGSYGYRMSKAALNAGAVSLARDLEGSNIAVGMIHPGWVRTEMTGKTGHVDPDESAAGILQRIENDLNQSSSGGFWHMNGERLPF
ncbi:MAG: short-chain dehydrogenase [Bdellovibrionaceae bacterium]|nr:short-chain dehydrogenase [Pseudobdellovibrionaceae bacterium]